MVSAVLLALCGCGDGDGSLASVGVCGLEEAGGRQVRSSAPSSWTVPPPVRELWRFPAPEEEPLLFPVGMAVSRSGTAAVPDFGRGEVLLVDGGGRHVTDANHGEAFAALEAPVAAAWSPDGTLIVWDLGSGDIVTPHPGSAVSRRGVPREFRDAILETGELIWVALREDESVLAVRRERIGRDPTGLEIQREALLHLRPGTSAASTVVADTFETAEGWPRGGSVALTIASSPAGALAITDRSGAYRIHVTMAGGERLIVCRDEAGLPVTPAERGEEAPAEWRNLAAALAAAGPVENPATVGRMFFDAEERLWVQRERPRPYGDTDRLHGVPGATYDVFAQDGTLLGSIAAPPGARLQTALGDTLWSLESAAGGAFHLVAYILAE